MVCVRLVWYGLIKSGKGARRVVTDLNDMMVFLNVAEQGSFTAAANKIGLPKSNISRKISRLEESLSVQLIERSTRSMHLTEIGQVYFQHCQRILDEMQSAQQCVENLAAIPKGKIKLCASVGVGQGLLAKSLARFSQQFDDVELDLKLTNRRIDIVEEGFDLAIRVGESPDSSLISKKLVTIRLALFASPEYLLPYNEINTLTELKQHQCLFMSSLSNNSVWPLYHQEQQHDFAFTPKVRADDFNVLKTMVLNDCGIGLFPEYLCGDELEKGQLTRVLPNWFGRTIDIYAIYPSRKGVTPKIRALLDFLSAEFI